MNYKTTPLKAGHKRSAFCCGLKSVDDFIQTNAAQAMEDRTCVVFIKEDKEQGVIQGFYTLSNDSIPRDRIPAELRDKLPKYPKLGVTLIGQLGVRQDLQGKGLGTELLMDAIFRAYVAATETSGSIAVVIDPATERNKESYKKFGFIELPDNPRRLFIPMATIEALIKALTPQ